MKIKKILLIRTDYGSPLCLYTMPLGIMYISAYIKNECKDKYQIKLLSSGIENMNVGSLVGYIDKFKPDLLGLSAINCDISNVSEIVGRVKKKNPEIITVIGGSLATSAQEELFKFCKVDFSVVGEGEITFLELLKFFDGEIKRIEEIDGIGYIKDGEVIINKKREYIKNLDSFPFPDYSDINLEGYWEVPNFSGFFEQNYAAIITSRGCPYRCTYCFDMLGKRFRARSPENIFLEMKYLQENFGIKKIQIVDDVFNLDRNRTEKLLDLIIDGRLDIGLSFPNGLRSDILDGDLLEKFKKAGTYFIIHALETASERLQKKIRKNLNLKKVKENIKICDKLEIMTKVYAMIGFPDETKEEVLETIEFIRKSKADCADFFKVTPIQGTELFNSIKDKLGKVARLDQMYYYAYNLKEVSLTWRIISDSELKDLQGYAYRRVYNSKRKKKREGLLRRYSMITFRPAL